MNRQEPDLLRRLVSRRVPRVSMPPRSTRIAASSPDLALLEHPQPALLARLGLTIPDHRVAAGARMKRASTADLRWLEDSGCHAAGLPRRETIPSCCARSPDAPAVLFVRGNAERADRAAARHGRQPQSHRRRARDGARVRRPLRAPGSRVSPAAWRSASTPPVMKARSTADGITVAVLAAWARRRSTRAEHQALAERIAGQRRAGLGIPAGHAAAGGAFSAAQSHHRRPVAMARWWSKPRSDSGSLITARLAGVAGREVFAIPGSIHNPLARGCHELIRQGAKLVESVEDVLGASSRFPLSAQLLAAPRQRPPGAPRERPRWTRNTKSC